MEYCFLMKWNELLIHVQYGLAYIIFVASSINEQKYCGLKQCNFILFQFGRLTVENQDVS